jgi:hypothetical protein
LGQLIVSSFLTAVTEDFGNQFDLMIYFFLAKASRDSGIILTRQTGSIGPVASSANLITGKNTSFTFAQSV